MKIVVIGVGKELYKSKEDMKKIAGKKGTVLVYGNFDALINSVDDLLKATCGKLLLLPPYVLVQKYFDRCLVKSTRKYCKFVPRLLDLFIHLIRLIYLPQSC